MDGRPLGRWLVRRGPVKTSARTSTPTISLFLGAVCFVPLPCGVNNAKSKQESGS